MSPTPRHQRPSVLSEFLFGAPYYPEHWSEKDRALDAVRMKAAGMNVVRMGEFAWDLMEPRRGKYDFALFDETIEKLGAHGIRTILCTPTATPPRWLTKNHEDWMRVDAVGNAMTHGSRQQCCTTNPAFRRESERITKTMAAHFRKSPHVIGWQTDNEFYCHFSECYCAACEAGFRQWLKRKYKTVGELNRAWGTAFWALTYGDFEEIGLPRDYRPTFPNPGQQLDYYRFLRDSLREFQYGQVQSLRKAQPRWWISHNGTFWHVDYWNLGQDLDFLGVDVYPGFAADLKKTPGWGSFKNQECRSASGSYVIFEQQAGAGGQQPYLHRTPQPGQMRLWAYQSIAHGADGILHFRWRSCRFGAEIYWNGILDHDNIPRRRYEEFSQEGAELQKIGSRILGTTQLVKAAILTQIDQDEAHATMPMGLINPIEQRKLFFHHMLAEHLPVGMVDASDSFAGLELIILPGFTLMDDHLAARLTDFVRGGGILLATARTATRDRNNQVLDQTPPGWLQDLFGITVEEFGVHDPLIFSLEKSTPAGTAYEILKPAAAHVAASWKAPADKSVHAASGQPALTIHSIGAGKAIYAGTFVSLENVAALTRTALAFTTITPLAQAGPLIEVTCRHSEDRRLYFVVNHDGLPATIKKLHAGKDLLSEKNVSGTLTLPPYGVAVIEAEPQSLVVTKGRNRRKSDCSP